MISKELLNKNRVLTMSNNRKCDYLIVNAGKELTFMMGINTQGNTKDILIAKTFYNKSFIELVNEAYWICKEFNIQIILADCLGFGLGFIDTFKNNIKETDISIRKVNIMESNNRKLYQDAYFQIEKDLKNGNLRFLQTSELASTYYQKPFLGYSNIMQFHKETDELINEISNIKLDLCNGKIRFSKTDDNLGINRANSLLTYYSYPFNAVDTQGYNKEEINEKYYVAKRMALHYINRGVFYKHMFKCIENEKLNTIFYCSSRDKILQFLNMSQETEFKELFNIYIKNIGSSKEQLEILLNDGSQIKFIVATESARGYRYHFAIVDTAIDEELYKNVIYTKGILFDIAKRDGLLSDIYNIEFIEM
jgi:hypothetical protein